jgi:hypothetical protein
MKTFSCSFLMLCLMSPFALANGPAQQVEGTYQTLSFSELREACQNPAKFHNQRSPSDIQISCKDSQLKWVADTEMPLKMSNQRQITTSIYSDKYSSSVVTGSVAMAEQVVACPRFREVREAVEVSQATTCDEISAYKGSAIEYCVSTIDALRAVNPAALVVTATGRTVSYCAQANDQRAQQGSSAQQNAQQNEDEKY